MKSKFRRITDQGTYLVGVDLGEEGSFTALALVEKVGDNFIGVFFATGEEITEETMSRIKAEVQAAVTGGRYPIDDPVFRQFLDEEMAISTRMIHRRRFEESLVN